jgi:hypothetical protein
MYRRTATITVAALSAGAEETYTITEDGFSTKAKVRPTVGNQIGDVVVVNGAPEQETGWGITSAWVDSPGVIKFKASNFAGTSLSGGSLVVTYCVLR